MSRRAMLLGWGCLGLGCAGAAVEDAGSSSSTPSSASTSESDSAESDTESGDATETETGETGEDCPLGTENCPCTPGCDPGLMCMDGVCVPASSGDGDGDGDGDPASGLCNEPHAFMIEATDVVDRSGWDPFMSPTLGLVLRRDNGAVNDYVRFELDIPCEDFWHVWVRGVDNGDNDSYFVSLDGLPNPAVVFELDCTSAPGSATMVWRELNYRAEDAADCESTVDPWVQYWSGGVHDLTISYRESNMLSRIYVTNTNDPP